MFGDRLKNVSTPVISFSCVVTKTAKLMKNGTLLVFHGRLFQVFLCLSGRVSNY